MLRLLKDGKPNKIIAYELGMAEATVKVHIRVLMRKLNAQNRTQVVLKAGDKLQHDRPAEISNRAVARKKVLPLTIFLGAALTSTAFSPTVADFLTDAVNTAKEHAEVTDGEGIGSRVSRIPRLR